jgi:CheY-like chemotaxis protein/HPt (histidine-containing phosphotransfer) domain-containing protein
MGGELRARSEFGRGSRFYFELRQRICDKTPGGAFCRRARELPDERQYWNFSAPDATILLVDDDSVNLRVVLGLLRPYGMRVITASGGDEALRILKKEKADLVLMDQMMPEMDGVETTRHIRAMGAEYERLPVLALTANAMKGAREELLAGGMDDYISKPIEMRELSEKLRRWLPEEKLAGPAEMPQTDDGREDLPQIEGIDAEKGLSYMNTFSDYMMCLRDFRSIIPEKAARLEALAEKGDMKEYTAEVHGLKSSARLIGADTLADMAARLEKSGRSGLTDDVRSGTAKLLTAYRAFFDRLEPYASGEAENNETGFELTESEYAACLRELRQYVDRYECDSADHWSEKMRLARVPESCAASLAGLHRYILAAQFSACAGYIDELLEGLRQA